MTVQVPEVFVVGQTDVAPLTIGHPAASPALIDRCKTPPILEQDGLFTRLQSGLERVEQFPAKVTFHGALLVRLSQIDESHLGQ